MYQGSRVAVVVPAYNEAPHVRDVVESLPPLVDRAYVVDDASTDGTWDEIRAAVAQAPSSRTVAPGPSGVTDGGQADAATTRPPDQFPPRVPDDGTGPAVVAVRHPENRGRGAAVARGYRLALADDMDVVAVMDGDGQMDPHQLQHVVHPVANGVADYAKGNRLDGPKYWRAMSRWRLLGNVLLTGLTRISTGYWGLRDPQNGYTAISRDALEALPLSELYDDYGFLNDVLAELNLADARVADVSLPAVYGDEESGIRYRQFVPAVSLLLLWNFLRRLYVDGVRGGRVWLPATYALAGATWLAVLAAAAGWLATAAAPGLAEGGLPVSALAALGPAAAGGAGTLAALPLLALAATALALGLDRAANDALERHGRAEVEPG